MSEIVLIFLEMNIWQLLIVAVALMFALGGLR